MDETKEYRSATRSRDLIRQAYFSLLKNLEFSKITVSSIVERAGINRSTFYKHYPDGIPELARVLAEEALQGLAVALNGHDSRLFLRDPRPLLTDFLSFLESTRQKYDVKITYSRANVFRDKLEAVLSDHLKDCFPDSQSDPEKATLQVHYMTSGIVSLFLKWIAGGLSCSRELLIDTVAEMVQGNH